MNKKGVSLGWIGKVLLGLLVFAVLYLVPMEGLAYEAKVALAVYGLMIVWWCIQPIPWFATALIPLLIFPISGVMTLKQTVPAVFGDRIMFFLIFIFLFGKAIERTGLGKRIAIKMLNINWIHGNIKRFLIVYMIAVCVLEAAFGVVGAIVSVPIGVSIIDHIIKECDQKNIAINKEKLGSHIILCAAYAHVAGGLITIQGIPQNVLVLSIFEEQTGTTVSFFQWLIPGVICAIPVLIVSYFILNLMFRHEIKDIPGGKEYFEREARELGPMTRAEKRLAVVSAAIIVLWTLCTFVKINGVDFNWVSYLGLFLLFFLPSGDEKEPHFLSSKDLRNLNWDVIFMITVAVCFAGLLDQFGMIDYVSHYMNGLGGLPLLLIATFATGLMTNFLAGNATAAVMATLLIPLLTGTAIHPFIVVRVISIMAVGLMVPWAGTSAALFYGSQRLNTKYMATSGAIMIFVVGAICLAINMLLMNISWLYPPMV